MHVAGTLSNELTNKLIHHMVMEMCVHAYVIVESFFVVWEDDERERDETLPLLALRLVCHMTSVHQ